MPAGTFFHAICAGIDRSLKAPGDGEGLRLGWIHKNHWGWIGLAVLGISWVGPGMAAAGMIGPPAAVLPSGGVSTALDLTLVDREVSFKTGPKPDVRMLQLMARVSYGVTDWLNVFVNAGMADDDFRVANFRSAPTVDINFLSDRAMAYGGGLKLNLFRISGVLVGAGGQYERFTLKSEKSLTTTPPTDSELLWQEYRFFIGAHAKEIPYFSPYLGLYLTLLDGEFSSASFAPVGVGERNALGLVYGARFQVWRRIDLLTEFQLVAETSLAFSVQYTF